MPMLCRIVTLGLAAATVSAEVDDWVSLLQARRELSRDESKTPLAKPAFATEASLVAQCQRLGLRVNRSSREEALPTLQVISDDAHRLLEMGATSGEQACIAPMASLALFNHPFAVVAHQTEGTRLLDTAVELVKRHPDDAQLLLYALPHITNLADPLGSDEFVAEVISAGGLEAMFAALEHFTDDKYKDLQMMAWAALSDFAHTEAGAAFIANHGGRGEGCRYMVQQMQRHPEPYFAKTALSLTLKYEILQLANGMLKSKVAAEYAEAFVDAGLLDQLLYTMQVEDGLRASQDIGCEVLAKMIRVYPPVRPALHKTNVTKVLKAALAKYGDDAADRTPFLTGNTMGQAYPVGRSCRAAMAAYYLAPRH